LVHFYTFDCIETELKKPKKFTKFCPNWWALFLLTVWAWQGRIQKFFRGWLVLIFFVWTGKFRGDFWIFFLKNPSKKFLKKGRLTPKTPQNTPLGHGLGNHLIFFEIFMKKLQDLEQNFKIYTRQCWKIRDYPLKNYANGHPTLTRSQLDPNS